MTAPDDAATARHAGAVTKETARLYDWLSRYVQIANLLAYGDRFAGFTMHKALRASRSDEGEPGTLHVNQRLLAASGLDAQARVLDAGCGFGGTIFHFAQTLGATCVGLTLSAVQVRVARREARRRGLERNCRFELRSYEEPIEGRYDAVLSIEALVHATDLSAVVMNLAGCLDRGGRLCLVEDLPQVDLQREFPAEADALAVHWSCRRWPVEAELRSLLAAAGLEIETDEDLTSRVLTRDRRHLDRLERRYLRLYRWFSFLAPVRAVLSAYLGGLAIERLYAAGALRYRLLVARRVEARGHHDG